MPLSISCLYYTICDIEKARFVAEFVAEFFSISATILQNTEKSFIQPQWFSTRMFAKLPKTRKNRIKIGFQASNLKAVFGGGGGSWTPVRKQLDRNFSGCSLLFTFPCPGESRHPPELGSFMMHGAGKAYRTHGLHSNHTLARLVDLPGRMGA